MVLSQAATAWEDAGGAMQWQGDLDAARTMAEQEKKLLLVHFYTESCGPCRVLDATVFNQPSVASTVHSNYIPVKLNANEFQATAERFGITRVPADVIITPQGRVLERMVSPATPMEYIAQISGIAHQYRQQAGREFPVAAANAARSQPVNSAYAGLAVPGDNNAFTAATSPMVGGATANPYATDAGSAAPQYNPAATTSTPTSPPLSEVSTPVAVANPYMQQPTTSAVPTQAPSAGDRYATAATGTPAPTAPTPPVAAAEPQLPANSPPLGFFGYCPVTMKKENRWQRGDARWGCYHRGRTYLFASAANRDEFLANGDAYAPALSGIDPVLAIDSNVVEPGQREFGIDFQGRFYLFSSEDNLRKFWAEADRYAAGVRQAMNAGPEAPMYR
jgi:protein disulfide-isomerase